MALEDSVAEAFKPCDRSAEEPLGRAGVISIGYDILKICAGREDVFASAVFECIMPGSKTLQGRQG